MSLNGSHIVDKGKSQSNQVKWLKWHTECLFIFDVFRQTVLFKPNENKLPLEKLDYLSPRWLQSGNMPSMKSILHRQWLERFRLSQGWARQIMEAIDTADLPEPQGDCTPLSWSCQDLIKNLQSLIRIRMALWAVFVVFKQPWDWRMT